MPLMSCEECAPGENCPYKSKAECERNCTGYAGSDMCLASAAPAFSGIGIGSARPEQYEPPIGQVGLPTTSQANIQNSVTSAPHGFAFLPSGGMKAKCACDSGFGWQKQGEHPCGCDSGSGIERAKASCASCGRGHSESTSIDDPSSSLPQAGVSVQARVLSASGVPATASGTSANQGLASAASHGQCGEQKCTVDTYCYPSGTGLFGINIQPFHHCYLEVKFCDPAAAPATYELNFDDGGLRPGFETLGPRHSLIRKNSAPRAGAAPKRYARKTISCPAGAPDPCKCIEDEASRYPFSSPFEYGIPIATALTERLFANNPLIYGPNSNTFVEYVKRQCNMGGGAIPITALGYYFLAGGGGRAFRRWRDEGKGRRWREVGGRWVRRG